MPLSAFDHPLALIVPSLMESFLFGIIRLGSTLRKMPSPVQVGHAPKGLLNENIRGDNSSIQAPCSGHAKFCENSNSSPPITSTMTFPPVRVDDISIASARRLRISSFITSLSTTISMLCFIFFSSLISSERSYKLPSIRTRTNPDFLAESSSF